MEWVKTKVTAQAGETTGRANMKTERWSLGLVFDERRRLESLLLRIEVSFV